jgi:predicted acetyltransferase
MECTKIKNTLSIPAVLRNLLLTDLSSMSNRIAEPIVGEEIALMLNRVLKEDEALEHVPAYLFDIVFHDGSRIGQIDLRIGTSESLLMYGGQIGYGIDRAYRGHGYAATACLLLKEPARALGFEELWITCNPDNIASVKTCENIGAKYIERVDVPKGSELWHRGDREKLRFLWSLV